MPTPTGEGAALLKAICDQPEEDTPRLVYADWLDEQAGHLPGYKPSTQSMTARAEFIRIQVAEAAKPVTWLNSRPWTKREYELYRPHYEAWKTELPTYPGIIISSGNQYGNCYERGFPFEAYAKSVRSFLMAAPKLFARVPVTQIRFETITPKTAGELARSVFLSRVRYFDQLNGITDEALAGLAGSSHLGNVTKLVFGGREVTAKGLVPFLASPSLTRVTDFMTLHCPPVGRDVVPGIVASPSAAALEEVGLQQNGLGAAAGPHFRELFRLPRLHRLDLEMNQLADEGAEYAADVEVDTTLGINLGWNHITDRGAEALLRGPLLRSPRVRVSLAGNQLSDAMKARLKDAFGDRVGV